MTNSIPITGNTIARLQAMQGSPHRKLWLAVVCSAILNDPPDALRRWLRSADGREVCALAGVDPRWIERKWCDEASEPGEAAA